MRGLPHRPGGAAEVRSFHEGQDVCELSSGSRLRGAQEGGPGRQVIAISRCDLLELLAGASAHPAIRDVSSRAKGMFDWLPGKLAGCAPGKFRKTPNSPRVRLPQQQTGRAWALFDFAQGRLSMRPPRRTCSG